MSHADYDIVRVEPDRVFIIDLDLGNKSVTNDAEYVYYELHKLWPDRRLIYRDSMGRWDEIVWSRTDSDEQDESGYPDWKIEFKPYKEHLPEL